MLSTCALLLVPFASPQTTSKDADPSAGHVRSTPLEAPIPIRGALASLPPQTNFLELELPPEGDMPRDVAFHPDGGRVLVVNRDTDSVSVFEFSTRTLLASIDVGDFPVDVEVAPDGSVAAVPNVLDGTVSFIDMGTYAVVATVPVSTSAPNAEPYRVAFDDGSTRAIVGVTGGAVDSRLAVIDLGTFTETASISTSPQGAVGFFATPESGIFGNLFTDFAVSLDGTFALVPDRAGDVLNAYAIPSGALLASLAIGDFPSSVDLSNDGTTAVVSLAGTLDAVVALDLVAGVPTIRSTTPLTASAFDPFTRLTPDKTQAVVAVLNAVEFIDIVNDVSLGTVSTGTVGDIEFSYDDQFVIVTNFNTRIIRLSNRTVARTLSFGPTYDAAVSSISYRMVGLNNRFAENVHFYTTNGASGQFEGATLSGAAPEIDAPRRVTITPDGGDALVTGMTSRSVVRVDLDTETITDVYDVGDRVWEVATDAAGTVAVVTSTESNEVQVVDLTTDQVVATLGVPTRPTALEVAPDGSEAYVTTVAGTDRLAFIELNGAASSVVASIPTGQLGSILYAYNQSSGIALSPDGDTLAICVSFDDELLLVDVPTRSVLTRVPVGDFPLRAAWSPDGAFVYVANTFGDSVSRVAFSGATSAVTGTANAVDAGFPVVVDDAGAFVYVGENSTAASSVAVIDAATMARVATVGVSGAVTAIERFGDTLFVAAGGDVHRVRAAGAGSALLDSQPITAVPGDLAFSASRGTVVTTQPGAPDGMDLTTFGGTPSNECGPAVPNSTGASGRIDASGTFLAGGFPLRLIGSDLPPFSFGYFLNSRTTGFTQNPGGSQGNLCLGGTIGRFNTQVQNSGAAGVIAIDVDTNALPSVPMSVAIVPGETWSFQLWHRDGNPGPTSNFTDRVTITFE